MEKAARSKISTILLGCVAIYLCSSGISELDGDIKTLKNAASSVSWPSADAEITNSIFSTIRRGKSTTTYGPELTYKYTVDGAPLSGTKTAFYESLDRNESEEKGRAILNHYPVGSHHKVYYSPDNKKDAVLVPGVNKEDVRIGSYMKLLVAGILIALAGINFLALRFPQTVMNKMINFVATLVVCGIAFYGWSKVNDSVIASHVPSQSVLRVEEDGYFVGEKKFEY